MEAFRRELDATRKEVMRLKQQEADMQIRMEREEKKNEEEAAKDLEQDLMRWRWEQAEASKELEAKIAADNHGKEIVEHLESVEFKRQVRAAEREKERKQVQADYEQTMENVSWEEQAAKESREKEKAVLEDHVEDQKATRDVLITKAQREKEEIERTREEERSSAMDFERRKLLEELNRLRESVGVVQSAYERRRK